MTRTETIKRKLRAEGVPQWRLAEAVGIHEQTLYRQLRQEITQERYEELMTIITDLTERGNNE